MTTKKQREEAASMLRDAVARSKTIDRVRHTALKALQADVSDAELGRAVRLGVLGRTQLGDDR